MAGPGRTTEQIKQDPASCTSRKARTRGGDPYIKPHRKAYFMYFCVYCTIPQVKRKVTQQNYTMKGQHYEHNNRL